MNYAKTRRTLSRPAPHVLAAIEDGRRLNQIARQEVLTLLAQPGADAMALYRAETDKERRVVLLGYLRRGQSALD